MITQLQKDTVLRRDIVDMNAVKPLMKALTVADQLRMTGVCMIVVDVLPSMHLKMVGEPSQEANCIIPRQLYMLQTSQFNAGAHVGILIGMPLIENHGMSPRPVCKAPLHWLAPSER